MTPEQQKALALAAARKRQAEAQNKSPQPNPDGTYGQPPEGMFLNPQTGQMTNREMLTNNARTSRAGALGSGFLQGFSAGSFDEMAGAGDQFRTEQARAQIDANARDYPGTDIAGRIAGGVTSPISKALGPARTIKQGVAAGVAYGGIEGFFSGEGGATERLQSAGWGGAAGGLFAGLSGSLFKGADKAVRATFTRADKRPSIDALKAAKNSAYAAVRRAGIEFDTDAMQALSQRVMRRMKVRDFDDIADPQTAASLRIIQARADQPVTLNRLDKLRQNLWDRYSRSDEPGILDIIAEIDTTIERAAEGNDLLKVARAANSKYAKAQLLENAFNKAELQTAATGSGGNILNKYRQAVTRIITSPKEAKWFTPEEIALMERFVRGDDVENTLRRVGKLAPGGNGLMTALNVYAASVDPTMLAVTGIASAAKGAADKSAMRGSEAILDSVSTGIIRQPKPAPNLAPYAIGGAAGGGGLLD